MYRNRLVFPLLLSFGFAAAHADAQATAAATLGGAAFRADLAQFQIEFLGVDRSFSNAARSQAEHRVADLAKSLDTISPAQFEIAVARIVALADNGHTNASTSGRSVRHNRVPVRLALLGNDFYVLRSRSPHADLLGARLVAIDQRAIGEVKAVARTLIGGTDAYRDRQAPFFFESPQLLRAAGLIADTSAALYRFELPDGRRIEKRLVGDPPDAQRARFGPTRWMFPEPEANDGAGWQSLLAASQAPWSLKDVRTPFRWREATELNALVIEMRQNHASPGHPIEQFMADVEAAIKQRRPTHLVLDMRLNGGGNLQLTRDFAQRLPTLVPGRIFALTSPWTFSAAISTVGYLKQAAPERVTIVGELVGDRLEFWAEGGPTVLRNSGIQIGRSLERHDYANGCRSHRDCHAAVVTYPISVRSLNPDIVAPWNFDAYRAGRDPAIEAVTQALRRAAIQSGGL